MINNLAFENKIVFYLLYENRVFGSTYEYFVNGRKAGETKKSHFVLDGLTPNSEYKVQIVRKTDGSKETVFDGVVSTLPEKERVDVTKAPYFVKSDGKTLSTERIQRAITESKGKTVYFPKGEYLSGALFLPSGTEICLDEGAVLKGSRNPEDYLPKIASRFEGIEMQCYASLINIGQMDHDAPCTTENVKITGKGIIREGGNPLKTAIVEREKVLIKDYLEQFRKTDGDRYGDDIVAGRARGRLVNVSNAKNVLIEGVGIEEGPAWNVHILYSENVITTGCTFRSFGIGNGDGWDPDSSKNCLIFNCLFDMGDDCIAIKSGKNPQGDVIARPSENIYVFDCTATAGHGCAIGSEMSGGVKNVFVWDCDFERTLFGLHIKTTQKRGGYIRDVFVDNCSFPCIRIDEVGYNDDGLSAKELPVFERFELTNLSLSGISYLSENSTEDIIPVSVLGLSVDSTKFRDFLLKNVTIGRKGEFSDLVAVKNATDIQLDNVQIKEK